MPRTGLGIRAKRLLTRTIRPFDLLTKGRNTYCKESVTDYVMSSTLFAVYNAQSTCVKRARPMKLMSMLRLRTDGGTHSHSPRVTQAAACTSAHNPEITQRYRRNDPLHKRFITLWDFKRYTRSTVWQIFIYVEKSRVYIPLAGNVQLQHVQPARSVVF